MILSIDSNAAYLVLPQAKSSIMGYFQLNSNLQHVEHPEVNGAILVECKALRHVVSLVAEAETTGVFYNTQVSIPIQYILQQFGHLQPPIYIKTDNSTVTGFVHNNIHQKKSKSWDMRYHWLRDCQTQCQFNIY